MKILYILLIALLLINPVYALSVPTGFNETNASASITHLKNYNMTVTNFTEYPLVAKILTVDENNTSNLLDIAFTPINSYWLDADIGLGYWLYVVIVILTVGVVYIKTKSLETTSITIMVLALLVAAPASAGTIIVPTIILHIMYVVIMLCLAAIFLSLYLD